MDFTLIAIFVFIIGTMLGSFLSVLVNRIIKDEKGIIFGKSHCTHCRHQLHASQLIPIISWLAYRGKCAFCHKKISREYPLIEIITGTLLTFVFINWQYASSINSLPSQLLIDFSQGLNFIYQFLLLITIITICYFDLKIKAVPNLFLLIWICLCLLNIQFSNQYLIGHFWSLIAVMIFFGGQMLLSKKWLGSADLIFSVGAALLFDLQLVITYIAIGYLLGGIYAALLLITKKASRKSTIAFLPFLGTSTLIVIYFGQNILDWYFNFNLLAIS